MAVSYTHLDVYKRQRQSFPEKTRGGMHMTNEEYGRYVDALAPRSKTGKNLLNAFWVGGLICAIGQALLNGYQALGLDETTAGAAVSISLVLLSAILTGFAVYDDIAKFAGAGTLVPITGFANAVVAPAIEFQTDESDIIGLSQKAFKHLDASMMI